MTLGADNSAGSIDQQVVDVDLTFLHHLNAVHGLVEAIQRAT